jgi:hypothetical protein
MNATAADDPADRFPTSFEEFRDAWAVEERRKGLAGAMHRAIMRLLNALVALLAEARADRIEGATMEGVAGDADGAPAAGDPAAVTPHSPSGGEGFVCVDGRMDVRAELAVGNEDARSELDSANAKRNHSQPNPPGQARWRSLTPPLRGPLALPDGSSDSMRIRDGPFFKNPGQGDGVCASISLRYSNKHGRRIALRSSALQFEGRADAPA